MMSKAAAPQMMGKAAAPQKKSGGLFSGIMSMFSSGKSSNQPDQMPKAMKSAAVQKRSVSPPEQRIMMAAPQEDLMMMAAPIQNKMSYKMENVKMMQDTMDCDAVSNGSDELQERVFK